MKKLLLIGLLLLCSCEGSTSREITTNEFGSVVINGKTCEVLLINVGRTTPVVFVDCGQGSSSTTYNVGKQTQTVGQYIPPASVDAGCPQTPVTTAEDLRRFEEVKKAFYGK